MKNSAFKKLFFIAALAIVSMTGAYGIYSVQFKFKTTNQEVKPMPDDYISDWKKVKELEDKGLTQSALQIAEGIYKKAKAQNNSPQLVKALIHKMKFKQQVEENSTVKVIDELKAELKTAGFPLKAVLHSMLAEVYWGYYQQNRWKFHDRTSIQNNKENDISTWDLKTIFSETIKNYQASLQHPELLKKTPLNEFDAVLIEQKSTRKLRPTLFDFLAHRAIDFYKNEESDLIRPAYKFELDDTALFSSYSVFSNLKIVTKDTLSASFEALKLFQELILLHNDFSKSKSEKESLVEVDLERLKFINQKSIVEQKDSLYLLALQNLEKQFSDDSVSAQVSYEVALVYENKGNNYKARDNEQFKWMKKQAWDVCEAAIKKFPGSSGAKNCKSLKGRIEEHRIDLVTDKVTSPDKPSLGLLSYKNLKKVYIRIIQPEKKENQPHEPVLYNDELINYYVKFPAIKEWSLDLPDDEDFQTHSTEIKIPELEVGDYVVLVGSSNNFTTKSNGVAYAPLKVSGISYVIRRMINGGYDCFVQHRETGVPLKGVNAQLYYEKYDYKTQKREYNSSENYVSDENGYFQIAPASEYRSVRIDFTYNASTSPKNTSDHLRADNVIYQYQADNTEKKKTPRTFFFLDRGIYRPGQTIYFKGIMINTDQDSNEILAKTKTKVSLLDMNGQQVVSLDLVSNDYGTFNGSFTAPVGALNGDMSISNESGMAYFSVEEYKRPKFEIDFQSLKGNYRLNDQIQVTGIAKTYSGAGLSSATVKYRVIRNATYPYQPYFSKSYLPPSPQLEVTNGITSSSDTGSFFITFKAIPDAGISKKLAPVFTYTVYADVTDINGETHSAQKQISIGYTALKLEIDIPEAVNKNSGLEVPVRISNLNNEPVPVTSKIEIYRLKQPGKIYRDRLWEQPDKQLLSKDEFEKDFPTDQFSDEKDRTKWTRQEKVVEYTLEPGTKSWKMPDLKKWETGAYVLEAHCKDAYGEDVKFVKYITVYTPSSQEVPVNEVSWLVEFPKSTYEPGDKAQFLIGSKEKDVHVIYEVERMGVSLKKEHLILNNEQKVIELPIEEKHRGGIGVHYIFIKNNRSYGGTMVLTVPYTNKELDIQFETFRNKLLPGQQEEWKLKIKDKKGDKAVAEMVATLYDASLDQFRPNNWYFDIYRKYFMNFNWESQGSFSTSQSDLVENNWNQYFAASIKVYEQLNWFGFENYDIHVYSMTGTPRKSKTGNMISAPVPVSENKAGGLQMNDSGGPVQGYGQQMTKDLTTIATRKNFSETAFFYPQLETDAAGNIIIKFTIPEATTRWKMLGLAHTKDLKIGSINKELVTQKELMVTPNVPRFFRENDKLSLTTKITNLSDADLTGEAQLFLYDAITMKEISSTMLSTERTQKTFILSKKQNTVVSWSVSIPENIDAITCKVVAKAGNFTDGEEMVIPVLTNRMLVTESLPLYVNGAQTKNFRFEKLANQNNGSATLRNHKLTLEFTSNPAWYAVQALPYLMEYPYDCSEQIFSRFYANSIATHVANASPKIKTVFDAWRNSSGEKATLLSNLEKNEELKSVLLEETPWVMQAKDESERKKRVGLLFDLNKMSSELNKAVQQLKKKQTPNGSWPWFEGMPEDRYITQYIVTGMGHLDHLKVTGIRENPEVWSMVQQAIRYMDKKIQEDYELLLKNSKTQLKNNQLNAVQIQYLYARSYFKDIPVNAKSKTAFDYYLKQAEKYWLSNSRYLQGMIALTLNRYDQKESAIAIIKSLKENAIISEEMGMYWKENYESYYWYQSPIEAQALLIEAFDEVSKDSKSVDALKVWLLRSKQTQDWKTTKATAEAVYALLLKGTDWLSTENAVEITIGTSTFNSVTPKDETSKAEAGTGYFKTSWNNSEITPAMAGVSIIKKDAGVSWGALYWQYFEQLDKITSAKTPLQIKKNVFIQKNTDAGNVLSPVSNTNKLKVGDKLIVRMELRVDRNMEYVHLKDMRASGSEPVNVLSSYKYQDGLGYYESTRDASTNFFFGYLPKGTHVFEYPLMITHEGDFSNGISSIQCMYAPEYTSNSEGTRIKVGD